MLMPGKETLQEFTVFYPFSGISNPPLCRRTNKMGLQLLELAEPTSRRPSVPTIRSAASARASRAEGLVNPGEKLFKPLDMLADRDGDILEVASELRPCRTGS